MVGSSLRCAAGMPSMLVSCICHALVEVEVSSAGLALQGPYTAIMAIFLCTFIPWGLVYALGPCSLWPTSVIWLFAFIDRLKSV